MALSPIQGPQRPLDLPARTLPIPAEPSPPAVVDGRGATVEKTSTHRPTFAPPTEAGWRKTARALVACAALALVGPLGLAAPAEAAGTLHVLDTFDRADAHGFSVAAAARQAGFQGPIEGIPIGGRERDAQAILGAQARMLAADTPSQLLAGLDRYAAQKQVGLLHGATDAMRQMTRDGARDGALNISRNQNKAEIVLDVWNQLVKPENGKTLGRAIEAFGLDAHKITSADAAVAGPETLKLQQALIDRVSGATDHSAAVRQARHDYARAVADLNARNVSVVVSSGNEGTSLETLTRRAHHIYDDSQPVPSGARLTVPPDYFDNPLSTGGTTTVGAVTFDPQARVYGDSSPSRQVSVYANGDVVAASGTPEHGTSFSSPVVAAGLAHTHGLHKVSPPVAREMLERNLSAAQAGVDKPVVIPAHLSRFLGSTTF